MVRSKLKSIGRDKYVLAGEVVSGDKVVLVDDKLNLVFIAV